MAGPSKSNQPERDDATPVWKLHLWQFQAVRDVLLIASFVALVWVGYALRAVTVPLLIALLLAYLFEPLVSRLERHPKLSRPLVVGGVLATAGTTLVIVLVLITSAVVHQTMQFVEEVRSGRFQERAAALIEVVPEQYRDHVDDWFQWMFREVDLDVDDAPPIIPDEMLDEIDEAEEQAEHENELPATAAAMSEIDEERLRRLIREELALRDREEEVAPWGFGQWLGVARGGAGAVWNFLVGLIAFGFLFFLIPFYFFFFSVGYPAIREFFLGLIPERNRERSLELLGKMDSVVAGFVRGRIIISVLMGIMFAIGWWLCGVPYAIALGLVTGIFCAVPFLGIVGLPVAVGLLFYDQYHPEEGLRMAWWAIILWPSLVFIVVQTIESYAITPVIAGKATNLDPVTIIVAVIAGGSIMGIYGMLLAIPVAACLKIMITDVLLPKINEWVAGRRADPLPIE